ncbi:MAG: D-glycero-alpha-D-manno-heptose-1,7-bisphosphate 7-phosphatase [Bdellovibrionales bacterium]
MLKRPAVLLDRDGTLIVDKIYLNDPDGIEYLPGVFEALRRLRDRGFVFCVATNQSGVPRGLVDVRNLDEIHRRIQAQFCSEGIDILSFHSAPYMTDTDHPLRKPNPGMIFEAASWYGLDLSRSWMIGDRMTDVESGHRAGTRAALVGTTECPETFPFAPPEVHAPNLLVAADEIIARI